MKRYIPQIKKAAIVFLVSVCCLLVAAEMIYNRIETYIGDNHAIIFFYRTNVPGGQASAWQQKLAQKHPEIEHVEVQCFDAIEQAGSSAVGLPSSQSGWQIISTRMGAGECDILIVNRERYEFMLTKGYLAPIQSSAIPERALYSGDEVYGYDIHGMQLAQLEFPCLLEPHNRIESTDTASKQVILCLLREASPQGIALAQELLQGAVPLPEPQDEQQ